jgi:exopolyphosphatase/guanosine-5'-triphosphate,3'-diphosphate pyrophosphatase
MKSEDIVAAMDLGSNSFHMIVARITNKHVQILDRLREMVQLAAGLDERNWLSEVSQRRALDCLARFGQRLQHIAPQRLRIVGTNTLRQARNSAEFLKCAEELLGHNNIEIISGQEEARLIYLGVVHSVANIPGQRLVVDIGGGSTELIIGKKFETLKLNSLKMGCVNLSKTYFNDGRITDTRVLDAELHVQLKLEPVLEEYLEVGWDVVTGASGSIKTIQDVLMREGWSRDSITLDGLNCLKAILLDAGHVAVIGARWQMGIARAQVFTGGFIILQQLFEALRIQDMQVSEGALREGLIYDLLGRIHQEDVRNRTVITVIDRYYLDHSQSERVNLTAQNLLLQARIKWNLQGERFSQILEWAARLHEIGMLLNYSRYHKHGAYILQNANLPGFSQSDQSLLAILIQNHRRSFRISTFAHLPGDVLSSQAQQLCILLRLAVLLNRSRNRQLQPAPAILLKQKRVRLKFPIGWLETHPLTKADLKVEARFLLKAGYRLDFS